MRRDRPSVRLGITGSRHWSNERLLCAVLDSVAEEVNITLLVYGGASSGADEMAERWALEHRVARRRIPPDYEAYGKKRAPLVRNSLIVEESDLVVAFRAWGYSGGTDDTVTKAITADKLWLLVNDRRSR